MFLDIVDIFQFNYISTKLNKPHESAMTEFSKKTEFMFISFLSSQNSKHICSTLTRVVSPTRGKFPPCLPLMATFWKSLLHSNLSCITVCTTEHRQNRSASHVILTSERHWCRDTIFYTFSLKSFFTSQN